ncbi:MAG: hypothetical protein HRF49_09735 [bacterium]
MQEGDSGFPRRGGGAQVVPAWLLATAGILVAASAVIVILTLAMISSYGPSFGSANFNPFSPSGMMSGFTALPAHKSSDFKRVIHFPEVELLRKWTDSAGRDCLAARARNLYDYSTAAMGEEKILVFDSAFAEIARLTHGDENSYAITSLEVADVNGDGSPEAFAGVSGASGGKIIAYNLAGTKLFEVTSNYDEIRGFVLVDSPTQSGGYSIVFCDDSDLQNPYRAFSAKDGTRIPDDESAFLYAVGSNGFGLYARPEADWNGDGLDDLLFAKYDQSSGKESVVPLVDGIFEPAVAVSGGLDLYPPLSYFKYSCGGTERILYARNEPIIKSGSYSNWSIGGSAYEGNQIEWQTLDGAKSGGKTYKSSAASHGDDTVELADLTGDGMPEICAITGGVSLVVLDLAGNELLKKNYFGRGADYEYMDDLISGDFDGDGFADLAFIYHNGIFVPNLDSLRGDSKDAK